MAEFGLTRLSAKDVGIGIGVGLGLLMTAPVYSVIMQSFHLSYRLPRLEEKYGVGAGLVAYMLVGVLFEEFIFRSFLQTRLKDLGWKSGAIVTVTAALFSVPHIYQGFAALPFTFLFGLTLGFMFLRFRTVWPGLIAHYLYDGLAIGIQILWSYAASHR